MCWWRRGALRPSASSKAHELGNYYYTLFFFLASSSGAAAVDNDNNLHFNIAAAVMIRHCATLEKVLQ